MSEKLAVARRNYLAGIRATIGHDPVNALLERAFVQGWVAATNAVEEQASALRPNPNELATMLRIQHEALKLRRHPDHLGGGVHAATSDYETTGFAEVVGDEGGPALTPHAEQEALEVAQAVAYLRQGVTGSSALSLSARQAVETVLKALGA